MADESDTPELCQRIEARMDAQALLMDAEARLDPEHPAYKYVRTARAVWAEHNKADEAERLRVKAA